MKPAKEYHHYLFDLYGTLVDIHTDEENDLMWQRMAILLAADGGCCTPEGLKMLYAARVADMEAAARQQRGPGAEIDIGPVFAAMLEKSGLQAGCDAVPRLARAFRLLSTEKLRLFPGAAEMLSRLRQQEKRVYLLSNAQELFTLPELKALGLLQYFDGIVISSREGLKKPDARLYRILLERYGLEPEETVMVGNDDRADCWGAAQAGLDSMYVFTEQSPERTEPLPENCRILPDISRVI